jgi:hypothetical protein
VTRDFTLLASGKIDYPTIEIIHNETPEPRIRLLTFMEQMTSSLLNVLEDLMAFLCAKHVTGRAGISIGVYEIPIEQRANNHVRIGYAAWFGDQLVRAS